MSVNRDQLINLIKVSYGKQKEYLTTLTDQEKSAVGLVSDWSPKDVMAHIIYWNTDLAGELADLDQLDKDYGDGRVDPINAEIWRHYSAVTWAEIEDLLFQIQRDLIESLKNVSEDQLNDSQRYHWTNGRPLWQRINFRGFYHHLQHIAELLAIRGDVDQAIRLQEESAEMQLALDDADAWRGNVLYNLGCYYATIDQREKALDNIGRGIDLYPYLREWALQDGDLQSLRDDPGLLALLQ